MRRTLLLLALLAPALARAGAVTAVAPDDLILNIEECNSPTETVRLQWTVTFDSGSFGSGEYKVFATSKQPPATGAARYCEETDATDGSFFADQIGAVITALTQTQSEERLTSEFAPAAGFGCAEGPSVKTIHVCVHFYPSATPATRTAWAVGSIQLDLRRPAPPTGLASSPGDGALNVSWTAPTGGDVAAAEYRVEVAPSDGSGTPREVVATATSVRVGGLANGTQYDVRVWSTSAAGNDSATSVDLVGTAPDPARTPQPVEDFWDLYDGAEQGGCATGAAGPVALLGLAGLLALLRRRK